MSLLRHHFVCGYAAHTIPKCTRDGRRLMMILPEGVVLHAETKLEEQLGKAANPPPKMSGRMFNRPTDIAVHPLTGELFVTDGYGNARVHRLRSVHAAHHLD
eukprot:SAG11_NODE_18994_length_476_cov_0.957560_1_plen_102_part_00